MIDALNPTISRADERLDAARHWLRGQTGMAGEHWRSIAGDASYRRYFRLSLDGVSFVLMDAPPELEDSSPFVEIGGRLRAVGLHAPEIHHFDLERGFMLLEDLGDDLYRDLIDEDTVGGLFSEAFDAMAVMTRQISPEGLPVYGARMLDQELQWFETFYLARHRRLQWSPGETADWKAFCRQLIASAIEQPQVFVHRDVHSCNLMRTTTNSPGIIDFQDAARGPITYDLASLIWDRYIAWPRERLEAWMESFRLRVAPDTSRQNWVRWCDLMGLQRNIKIVGRFALLKYDQGKDGYVEMIPRFFEYLLDVLPRYEEFGQVMRLLEDPRCAP